IRSTELDIGFHCYRIVSLNTWVEEFVDRNWFTGFKSIMKIITLKHTGNSQFRRKLYHIDRSKLTEPCAIKNDLRFFRIKNFKNLLLVRLCVFSNLCYSQGLSGFRFTGRIADHAGKVAYEKIDIMT